MLAQVVTAKAACGGIKAWQRMSESIQSLGTFLTLSSTHPPRGLKLEMHSSVILVSEVKEKGFRTTLIHLPAIDHSLLFQ